MWIWEKPCLIFLGFHRTSLIPHCSPPVWGGGRVFVPDSVILSFLCVKKTTCQVGELSPKVEALLFNNCVCGLCPLPACSENSCPPFQDVTAPGQPNQAGNSFLFKSDGPPWAPLVSLEPQKLRGQEVARPQVGNCQKDVCWGKPQRTVISVLILFLRFPKWICTAGIRI